MVNLDLSCYNAVVQYCSMLWVCLGKEIISACLLCQWLWMVRVSHPCRSPDQPKLGLSHAGCGMACCLMTTDIIKQVMMINGTAFNPIPQYGEDLSFCKRAAALGFKIYAEPTVRLGHIAHIAIYPDDTPRYQDELQRN